jgi:anti-anti-sigma regulatory factor
MYSLNWNPSTLVLEASFGGCITAGECRTFLEDLHRLLDSERPIGFQFVIDYAYARRMDGAAQEAFAEARETALASGASQIVMVTRNEDEVAMHTHSRLQQVLEGVERYYAYSAAA